MNKFQLIYKKLYSLYGPQGWWPLLDLGDVNHKKGDKNYGGYHPDDYGFPKTDQQVFEICTGAILTQNTAWNNVVRALDNLKRRKALSPDVIIEMPPGKLASIIKSSGYHNQKAKKLKAFAEFYVSLNGKVPSREELLQLWGIGRETADSMLLYAYKVPVFVVDAYTRRIFSKLRLIREKGDYDGIRAKFENNIPKDLAVYQEYHALIVEHAKRHYSRKPYGASCPLLNRL